MISFLSLQMHYFTPHQATLAISPMLLSPGSYFSSYFYIYIASIKGVNPELDFGGGLNCLFYVKSFLTLLSAIGNIAIWGVLAPWIHFFLCTYTLLRFIDLVTHADIQFWADM